MRRPAEKDTEVFRSYFLNLIENYIDDINNDTNKWLILY